MSKSALFLIFFVLTLFVNAQDKMGFGNDTEGADSAGFGTVTTWVKPIHSPSDTITYEGVMTVGFLEELQAYGYIFADGVYNTGQITPPITGDYFSIIIAYEDYNNILGVESANSEGRSVTPFSTTTEIISFEIDGIEYPLTKMSINEYEYVWQYTMETNPFPAIGETCTIKIKYTSQ